MAVMPVGEWAAELLVAEVIVPGEFCDFGFPWDAHGSEGKGFEAQSDA